MLLKVKILIRIDTLLKKKIFLKSNFELVKAIKKVNGHCYLEELKNS